MNFDEVQYNFLQFYSINLNFRGSIFDFPYTKKDVSVPSARTMGAGGNVRKFLLFENRWRNFSETSGTLGICGI